MGLAEPVRVVADHPPAAILEAIHARRADLDRHRRSVDHIGAALVADDRPEGRAGGEVEIFGLDAAAEVLPSLGRRCVPDRLPADEQLAERPRCVTSSACDQTSSIGPTSLLSSEARAA